MTIWRGSLLFFQQGYGWSESWDWDDQNPGNKNPAAAAAIFPQLIAPRMGLAGSNTYLNGIRISAAGVFRDVALVNFAGTGDVGTQGTNGQSASPATALLAKHNPVVLGYPSSYRPYRGIPVSMTQQGGIFVPSGAWISNWTGWKNILSTLKVGWMGLTVQYVGTIATVIQTVGQLTATVTLLAPLVSKPPTVVPLPPINPFPFVMAFSGVQGATQVNGRHLWKSADYQTFISDKKLAISPYTAGGRALLSQKGFTADGGTGQYLRIDERKPGRPFYLSAGRRRSTR